MWDDFVRYFKRGAAIVGLLFVVLVLITLWLNPELIRASIQSIGARFWVYVVTPLIPIIVVCWAFWLIAGKHLARLIRGGSGDKK